MHQVRLVDTVPISNAKANCAFALTDFGSRETDWPSSLPGTTETLTGVTWVGAITSGTKERRIPWVGGLRGMVGKDSGLKFQATEFPKSSLR